MREASFERDFYGSVLQRGRWSACTLKGSLVRSRRRYLDRHAPDRLERVRAEVGPEARSYLDDGVLVSARLPYAPLVELDAAIVRHAMGGDVSRMLEMAREIASHDLDGGMYRGLLRAIGGTLSLRVYAIAYQTYWQPGRVVAARDPRGEVIALEGVVLPRYMCRYGFSGYVERLLELANAPARVLHDCVHEGDDACRWVITRP